MNESSPNLHAVVPWSARIKDVLGVKVKGHEITGNFGVALKLLLFLGKWMQAHQLAHRGSQVGPHPHFAQGQRSQNMGNFVVALKLLLLIGK